MCNGAPFTVEKIWLQRGSNSVEGKRKVNIHVLSANAESRVDRSSEMGRGR